jgi:hypothetical protein
MNSSSVCVEWPIVITSGGGLSFGMLFPEQSQQA